MSPSLPPRAAKNADNLIRDSRMAVLTGLIPILGLVFILRLVQWYLWAGKYPVLKSAAGGERAKDYRAALPRLWFAVLFWPVLIAGLTAYLAAT